MKVYLLWKMYHDADSPQDEVIRVYSTREKAEEHMEIWPIKPSRFEYESYYHIEEMGVD